MVFNGVEKLASSHKVVDTLARLVATVQASVQFVRNNSEMTGWTGTKSAFGMACPFK